MSRDSSAASASRFIKAVRTGLAILLFVSLVLIAQQSSQLVYNIGILLVMVTVLLGFTFNNIPDESSAFGVVKALVITWVIVGCVVGISIESAPFLIMLGR